MGEIITKFLDRLSRVQQFQERVERVKKEAERESDQPVRVLWFNTKDPDEAAPLLVIVGEIKKQRQQGLAGGKK